MKLKLIPLLLVAMLFAACKPYSEQIIRGTLYADSTKTKDSHQKIHYCGNQESRSHEATDIAIVSDETVCEFACCIHEIEGGPDDSKLGCTEYASVYQWLLDYCHGHPADVVQGIGSSHSPEGPVPEAPVLTLYFSGRNAFPGRL